MNEILVPDTLCYLIGFTMINAVSSVYSQVSNFSIASHFSLNHLADFSLINKIKQVTHSIFNRMNPTHPPQSHSTNIKPLAMFAVGLIVLVALSTLLCKRQPTTPSSPDPKITKKHI